MAPAHLAPECFGTFWRGQDLDIWFLVTSCHAGEQYTMLYRSNKRRSNMQRIQRYFAETMEMNITIINYQNIGLVCVAKHTSSFFQCPFDCPQDAHIPRSTGITAVLCQKCCSNKLELFMPGGAQKNQSCAFTRDLGWFPSVGIPLRPLGNPRNHPQR